MIRILRPTPAPLRLGRRCQCLRPTYCCPPRRNVSSSSNPFPYPTNANPTPHQIFHLSHSASRDQVKARYYDLVRIYHPDSPISRAVPPETAHSRFQSISSAYAVLSGKAKTHGGPGNDGPEHATTYHNLSAAMWRERQRRRADLEVGFDEVWKDRMILAAIFLALGLFVAQTYSMRQQAMTEALERARQQARATAAVGSRSRPDDSLIAAPVLADHAQEE